MGKGILGTKLLFARGFVSGIALQAYTPSVLRSALVLGPSVRDNDLVLKFLSNNFFAQRPEAVCFDRILSIWLDGVYVWICNVRVLQI